MFFGGGDQISPTQFVLELATGFRRAQGTMGHPNTLGIYFLLTWPLFLAMAGAPVQRWLRIACGGVALLALTGIVVTLSRTSWAVSIGQVGLVALGLVAFGMLRAKRLAGLAVVGALAVAIALAPFANRLYERLTGDFSDAVEFRVEQGDIALEIWQRTPLLGVGINNYSEILGDYAPDETAIVREFGEFIRINMEMRVTAWVHNIYLLFLAEQGILGLVTYLAFAFGMLLRVARAVAANVGGWRAAAYGMMVGMIGLHIHGLQESALWIDPITYSFTLVAALANNINAFAEGEQEASAPRPMGAPNLARTTA
jgi:O-antigen ligase